VSVTPASSNLKAKKVFHAAIRKYRNSKSAEVMNIVMSLSEVFDERRARGEGEVLLYAHEIWLRAYGYMQVKSKYVQVM